MQLPVIKQLVEGFSMEDLQTAENAILNGNPLSIEVGGVDEGEQLTHVLAAITIIENMKNNNVDYRTAQREYVKAVRDIMM
jgi:hypothetical protein